MLLKEKIPSLPKNVALGTFGKLLIVFSTKLNLLYLYIPPSDKGKLFAKNLFKNSNLDDSGISLPVFPSRTFLDCWKVSSVVPVFKDVWGKV